ncbi:hypothetical protein SKAU_G00402590 [Synaphobranchus kaupii]|uniref:Uncharacterized protein n=1 Tax=Synaphobranchus kaupii TaxID=118154 RepID=A0A9Q1IBP8_SYNKA|nr:hypothetical protein SKAU_G00402590 [Synaphobranchus kaupii]
MPQMERRPSLHRNVQFKGFFLLCAEQALWVADCGSKEHQILSFFKNRPTSPALSARRFLGRDGSVRDASVGPSLTRVRRGLVPLRSELTSRWRRLEQLVGSAEGEQEGTCAFRVSRRVGGSTRAPGLHRAACHTRRS